MDNRFYPLVYQVVPTDNFEVRAYMNDGSIRLFDVKPLIKENKAFKVLEDIEYFKETLTILNDTVAFDIAGNRNVYKCTDIDPFVIYDSPIYVETTT